MEMPKGKHAWIVKIGEKGQFVIPKEARELFDFKPGDSIVVLADEERGLAIPKKSIGEKHFTGMFSDVNLEGGNE